MTVMDTIALALRSKRTGRHFGPKLSVRKNMGVARGLLAVMVAVFAVCIANARTFRRSFRNGYPAEWNISREQAEDTFSIKGSKVTYSDGKGRIVTTDGGTVSQRNTRVVRPYRKTKRLRTPSNKNRAKPSVPKGRTE